MKEMSPLYHLIIFKKGFKSTLKLRKKIYLNTSFNYGYYCFGIAIAYTTIINLISNNAISYYIISC